MISFKNYLTERYITTNSPEEKEKHIDHDHAHEMIRNSYKSIGGYGGLGHGTEEESKAIKSDIRDPNVIMKLHRKDGVPHSVALYKKQHGRKLIAAGTNGSKEGSESFHKIIKADKDFHRSWGEVSKAMEKVFDRHQMPDVHPDRAEELTGKKIIRKHDSGHYDRLIGGQEHRKIIKGYPKQ